MNTYKWTCLACKSPNVLVHDTSKEGHVTLNCKQCGEPGVFEPEENRIAYPGTEMGFAETVHTGVTTIDSSMSLGGMPPAPSEIDYMNPARITKIKPSHWRV